MKINIKHLYPFILLFIEFSAFSQNSTSKIDLLNLDETKIIADSLLLIKNYHVNKSIYRNDCKYNDQKQRIEHWHCYLKDSTKNQVRFTCFIIDPNNGKLIREGGILEAYHNLDNCCIPKMEIILLDSNIYKAKEN